MRKRLFYDETFKGPFEVKGQEMRRVVGTGAIHQTHSYPGSGRINHNQPLESLESGKPRSTSGCAICARSFWLEDLYELDLFVRPETKDAGTEAGEAAEAMDVGDEEADAVQEDEACQPCGRLRYSVQPRCAEKVNRLLDVRRYNNRWPKIPKHELYASSVQHPYKKEWRWLLNTQRVPEVVRDPYGRILTVPPVPACHECAHQLHRSNPKAINMPRAALANDNWIGRMPFPLAPGGEPLSDMTMKTLARGRICVNKVIAEPNRAGPRNTRQSGLRGNSISFPQSKLVLQKGNQLPAPAEELSKYCAETFVIALAGVDKEDLHKAKWAQIKRTDFVDASHFYTKHSLAYDGFVVNEERAKELFAETGRSCDAVLDQTIDVIPEGQLPFRLDGPADTGVAGVAHSHEEIYKDNKDEDTCPEYNAAIPDPEFPEVALPTMNYAVDPIGGADVDELQKIRKLHKEFAELWNMAGGSTHDAKGKSRVHDLQTAARALKSKEFKEGLKEASRKAEIAESGTGTSDPTETYVIHTSNKPLSMYEAPLWAMCFPDCFPYGDGVFGLPRETPLTFQQWMQLLILREELAYSIDDEETIHKAVLFFSSGASGQQQEGDDEVRCSCQQCAGACRPFSVPKRPRWRNRDLICVGYDSNRRMAQIRSARAHVRREGYKSKLNMICNATSEKIEAVIQSMGKDVKIRDVLRSKACDPDLKEALSELQVFTSQVVGSDGARAKLRHEQNGYALMFGPSGGFLTPNMSDVRSPLVVTLHGGGVEERYEVKLDEECPMMPSAKEMLQIIAEDPVAQARYFIFCMRIFCEHVLGTGPFDDFLRHNGWLESPAFPDGFAASGLGGAFGMVAALHGPIEEQARNHSAAVSSRRPGSSIGLCVCSRWNSSHWVCGGTVGRPRSVDSSSHPALVHQHALPSVVAEHLEARDSGGEGSPARLAGEGARLCAIDSVGFCGRPSTAAVRKAVDVAIAKEHAVLGEATEGLQVRRQDRESARRQKPREATPPHRNRRALRRPPREKAPRGSRVEGDKAEGRLPLASHGRTGLEIAAL